MRECKITIGNATYNVVRHFEKTRTVRDAIQQSVEGHARAGKTHQLTSPAIREPKPYGDSQYGRTML